MEAEVVNPIRRVNLFAATSRFVVGSDIQLVDEQNMLGEHYPAWLILREVAAKVETRSDIVHNSNELINKNKRKLAQLERKRNSLNIDIQEESIVSGAFVSQEYIRYHDPLPDLDKALPLRDPDVWNKLKNKFTTPKQIELSEKIALIETREDKTLKNNHKIEAETKIVQGEADYLLFRIISSDWAQGDHKPSGAQASTVDFEQGVSFILNQEVKDVETGEQIVSYIMRSLEGRYDVLGSKDFQQKLDSFILNFENIKDKNRVRAAAIRPWITQTIKFIQMEVDEAKIPSSYKQVMKIFADVAKLESHLATSPRIDFEQVKYPFKFFSWSKKRQSEWLTNAPGKYERKYAKTTRTYIANILNSTIVTGGRGLLRVRIPRGIDPNTWEDSAIQQGKMLLLSIDNLQPKTVEAIFDEIQVSDTVGRQLMGKLPSKMSERVRKTGEEWRGDSEDRETFVKRGVEKANRGWPTPADGGDKIPLPNRELNPEVYAQAVDVRMNYLRSCIINGWKLPVLSGYLPKEVLSDREKMRDLVKMRSEVRKKNNINIQGWDHPKWRDGDGILYDSSGRKVEEPPKQEVIVAHDSDISKQNQAMKLLLRFAPSLGMALLAMQKSSKL